MTGHWLGKDRELFNAGSRKDRDGSGDKAIRFKNQSAVRALILYPMNALVNDQLGRLRFVVW